MKEEKTLTEREKLVIAGAVLLQYIGVKSLGPALYCAASPESLQALKHAGGLDSSASRWRNSKPVQEYQTALQIQLQETIKRNAVIFNDSKLEDGERETANTQTANKIDFANRDEFINYCIQAANRVNDEKQRIDYLKMLADLQRYKETNTGTDGDIQRFYTPIKCSNCPLYKAKKK